MCDLQDIEDEVHVLICPAYRELRSHFSAFFDSEEYTNLNVCFMSGHRGLELDNCMAKLMNVRNAFFWQCLADYLIHVRTIRRRI